MKFLTAILLALFSLAVSSDPNPVGEKKQYEGYWAETNSECLDKEGPNTRTLIDLSNKVNGKSLPIFDKYEWHCKILKASGNNKNTKLQLRCFESWDDLEKNIDGTKSNVSLTLQSTQSLKINGVKHERCND
jgi:hypothetical protein